MLKRKKWLHKKLISHKLKLVYLRIPKCASSSVMAMIYKHDPKAIYKSTKRYYDGYLHFTVIRDDNERLFSTWREKIQRKNYAEALEFIKDHPGLYYKMPFTEFVNYALTHKDPHWEPCETFLNENRLDLIISFESIIRWDILPSKNSSNEKSLV